jgi:uncharacterized delta-60 repeat protein
MGAITPLAFGLPADLDSTFMGTGIVKIPVAGSSGDGAHAVVVQPDGKIIIGGYSYSNSGILARLNPNGALDTSFGENGMALAGPAVHSITLQNDGKIVASGVNPSATDAELVILRLNSNGSVDNTFNEGGVVINIGQSAPNGEGAQKAVMQSDGKILISWPTGIARINPNGTLDSTFDGDGKMTISGMTVNSLSIQSDQKFIAVGSASVGGKPVFAANRYNTNGTLDTTFNATGKVTTAVGSNADYATCAAVDASGKIVVGGYSSPGSGPIWVYAAVRLNASGTLDTTFSSDGKTTFEVSSSYGRCYGIVIQNNGKIVLAGESNSGGPDNIALVRLTNIGGADASFGDGGKVVLPSLYDTNGGIVRSSSLAALQTDGKILIVGKAVAPTALAVARFEGDPVAPEIAVEQPLGTNLTDGAASVAFGSVAPGGNSSMTFTIKNTGTSNLTGLGITFDGTNAADFTVTASPTSPVTGPSGSTMFTVRFAPAAVGARTAALHLASNDADENPFDIALTGTGLSAQENWRNTFFGITTNTGNAADTFDFDNDGLKNLVEFAFGLNPTQGTSLLLPQGQRVGDNFVVSFSQPAGVSGVTYGAEWSTTLASLDWHAISDTGTLPQHTFSVPMGSNTGLFIRLKVTSP